MAQDIVVHNIGAVSTIFAPEDLGTEELSGGIVGSFAVLKYKGKVWSVQHKGDRANLIDEKGDALPSVEVVIIKSVGHLSKLFYKDGYQDSGSEGKRPDCWSSNGATPDALVPTPISPICVNCPMNAFGSRTTEAGKAGKACSDHKRMVVVPLEDMENEYYGGPMLLRIPAASLAEVDTYSKALKQLGAPYYGVGSRIRFDVNEAYPKLLFSPIRALNDDEARLVMELREDPRTIRILNEEPEAVAQPGDTAAPIQYEQPTPPVAKPVAPVAKPPAPAAAAPKPIAQASRPAPAPTPPAAAPKGFQPAPKPVAAPPPVARAGGFGRPVTPPAGPAGTIAAAVAQPAPRPPTTRPAIRTVAVAPPAPEEATGEEMEGGLPAGLDQTLDALLAG